ncbi:hypothetical protein GCM10023215_66260 [Pseudonocardia yuanmonensis]|uniref:Uncharacterized protein n=1 Tax=Pseudonocardia yuanmonensis TaxID=1095914 RepID=A0ABP8XSM9_9PSEU
MSTPARFTPARYLDPSRTVQGATDRFDCPDLASLDRHLDRLRRRIARDGGRTSAAVETCRADIDRLLDRRRWLTLPVVDPVAA